MGPQRGDVEGHTADLWSTIDPAPCFQFHGDRGYSHLGAKHGKENLINILKRGGIGVVCPALDGYPDRATVVGGGACCCCRYRA